MRILIASCTVLFSLSALSSTLDLSVGDVYEGLEEINESPTGRRCMVTVNDIQKSQRGLHCLSVSLNILHPALKLVSGLKLESAITNYHRQEHPALKTCARSLDGSTSSDDIYSQDTLDLVTSPLGGAHRFGGTQFNYFLTPSSVTKSPVRTRVHVLKLFSERSIDCVGLQLRERLD